MMLSIVSAAIALALVSSTFAYSKVGCFEDKKVRLLEGKMTRSQGMTIEKCVKMCSDEGDYFAALENAYQCFCGKHLRPYRQLRGSKCSKRCTGNRAQKCGGRWKASVYSTDVGYVYLGCYQDKTARILEGAKESSQYMTPQYCIKHCKARGKRFALTEYSSQCFCGNHLRTYAKKPDSMCGHKCSGDRSKNCGGPWHGSLYLLNYNDL